MKSKKWDPLICLVLCCILLVFVSQLKNTKPMARVYPQVIIIFSFLMIVLTLIQWFLNWKKGNIEEGKKIALPRVLYIIIYCASILIYLCLMETVGFIPMTIIFGVFSLVYLKCKSKAVIIILPIVVTFIMYFIFSNFLFVTLPPGLLRGIL